MIAVFTCVYLWLVLHLCCSPVFLCLWHFCISDPCLLTANCSLTLLIPITLYTIYFHPQHTVPTASEKDNMVISYLTLNIISIKTVSSIAVSLTLGDFVFFRYTLHSWCRPQCRLQQFATAVHHSSIVNIQVRRQTMALNQRWCMERATLLPIPYCLRYTTPWPHVM